MTSMRRIGARAGSGRRASIDRAHRSPTRAPDIDDRLTGQGWDACTVRFGDEQCEIRASYLSDALSKLVPGAAAIASGLHSVSIGFDEEPGEYRRVVTDVDAVEMRASILAFDEL